MTKNDVLPYVGKSAKIKYKVFYTGGYSTSLPSSIESVVNIIGVTETDFSFQPIAASNTLGPSPLPTSIPYTSLLAIGDPNAVLTAGIGKYLIPVGIAAVALYFLFGRRDK